MCAAAVSLEEDLLALTTKDERDLREYFQDASASVGGLKAVDYEKLLGRGSKSSNATADHEHISDRQIARAANSRRVDAIRDALTDAKAWYVLRDAYGKADRHYRGVDETLTNLLADTDEALEWGTELALAVEIEQAATRAYMTGKVDGVSPMTTGMRVLHAMDLAEAVEISDWRARDAAADKMVSLAGMLPGRRGRRNAERFETAQREAVATLARAADAWVRARHALGVTHREDQRDDGVRTDREAVRGMTARARLMLARSE